MESAEAQSVSLFHILRIGDDICGGGAKPLVRVPCRLGDRIFPGILRIQNRLFEITEEAPPSVHFCTECAPIGQGLEEQIESFGSEHPGTVLIIIDTLQMIRPIHDATYANV